MFLGYRMPADPAQLLSSRSVNDIHLRRRGNVNTIVHRAVLEQKPFVGQGQ